MRRIDALHLDYPFAGSRMPRDLLRGEGVAIGRELVATMMRRMGIEAIYRKPHTSKTAPEHKIYPYLLRGLAIERSNQVWAMDITLSHPLIFKNGNGINAIEGRAKVAQAIDLINIF
jgi:putative transposase